MVWDGVYYYGSWERGGCVDIEGWVGLGLCGMDEGVYFYGGYGGGFTLG